jgi:ABC-type transport system substrate-binding protein
MKSHVLSFLSFLKTKKVPSKENLNSLREIPFSAIHVFIVLVIVFIVSIFFSILLKANSFISVEVPDYGGKITEGVIGAPKYINPILAVSETDKLLSSLVYDGLMKEDETGRLIPAIASSCVSNPAETSYQCTISEQTNFSNKMPLSVTDVAFTFETKKTLALESDPQSSWKNISIQIIDPQTIEISSSLSSASLKEKMSLGIVPKALWESVPRDQIKESVLNMKPIGAGSFIVKKIKVVNTIPTEVILKRNPHSKNKPYIDTLIVRSFANQLDLKSSLLSKDIDSTSALRGVFVDQDIKKYFDVSNIETRKEVSLLVNQNQKDSAVAKKIKSLNPFIDKKIITDTIENGYGIPLLEDTPRSESEVPKITETDLQISIAVQKDEDLIKTAELLSESLKDFGIISTVNVFDQGIFTDQMSLGSYSFALGISTKDNTPPGYQHLVPIYTKTLVHIKSKELQAKTPTIVESSHESMRFAPLWYSRTDLVWKWFTHNI